MTQAEYNIIVQCIKTGVPALSNELILSLNNLVVSSSNPENKETDEPKKKKIVTNKKGEN